MSGALNSVLGGGNILGAALNIGSMFFPPLGIASSLANIASQAIGQGVNMAAQQMQQQLGMPKFLVDQIGDIVQKVLGQCQQPSDPECDAHCGNDRDVKNWREDFANDLCQALFDKVKEEVQSEGKKCGGGKKGGGGSWLEKLSRNLGEVAGEKAAKMVELSDKLTELSGKDDKESAKEMTAVSQELSGTSKLFQVLQDAANTTIKGIGDGLNTAARKT